MDRTCSGATIVGSAGPQKGPIIPAAGANPISQVDQALERLDRDHGAKRASDVDIVSVTMGGNDAGFGDLIAACLLPNMAKTLFENYDNAPGEIEWIVSHFGDCKTFDTRLFHTEDKIRLLRGVEEPAQAKLQVFSRADLFQLTYPSIVS